MPSILVRIGRVWDGSVLKGLRGVREKPNFGTGYFSLLYSPNAINNTSEDKKAAEENLCPLCGEDVRFFCDCSARDEDYRRPIPDGWKSEKHGFGDDHLPGYSLAQPEIIKRPPPPQPAPYRGR